MNMHTNAPGLPRRTFLRGLGTLLALPALESVQPVRGLAAGNAPGTPTLRCAWFYVPNGVDMASWRPATTGADFKLPPSLEPLAGVRGEFSVLTGLTCDKARPNGDGAGDHARAQTAYLTGSQPRKTDGANIRAGISADQLAARQVGRVTRLPSLELGIEKGLNAGNCDSGYSCAYSANLSWRGEATPSAKETDPRLVFERLFGNGRAGETAESRARRERYQHSILDFVAGEARALQRQVGYTDRQKVEEYLTAVRDVEQRIQRAEKAVLQLPGVVRPTGTPREYQDHVRLMMDMLVLAFQTDTTRVSTFMLANDGSNRAYPTIGVSDGHHELSHHQKAREKMEKLARINRFHITQFAYLLEKLKATPDSGGTGSLLDNCLIAYGSGISDGDRHNHDDLPVLLAGRGGGTVQPGRHIEYPKETPLCNLWHSMIDRMGVRVDRFGDGTGLLKNV